MTDAEYILYLETIIKEKLLPAWYSYQRIVDGDTRSPVSLRKQKVPALFDAAFARLPRITEKTKQ